MLPVRTEYYVPKFCVQVTNLPRHLCHRARRSGRILTRYRDRPPDWSPEQRPDGSTARLIVVVGS